VYFQLREEITWDGAETVLIGNLQGIIPDYDNSLDSSHSLARAYHVTRDDTLPIVGYTT
jgi:hypothetical protein